ncbi:MAG: DNA polymerase III subunit gamma/tau [Candidatus Saccharimonadales bacterium]
MSIALYRKYRSRSLKDIVGQSHVTEVLTNAIKQGRVSHAYLFTGPRGVGKTSIARILAHEINNLPYTEDTNHVDIVEIDAASNNGVDHIRDLRDRVQLAPMSANKKVYIIDEVHMLSKPAFNALLKTLEEPPEHVVFILATTDVDKLPDTIISRTQRHAFRRASIEDLEKNLTVVAKKENLKITPEAITLIAQHSDGSYRDSLSLLDQIANLASGDKAISRDDVEHNLGLASQDVITSLVEAARIRDITAIQTQLADLESRGIQSRVVTKQLITYIAAYAVSESELLPLLDALLDVEHSPLPEIKLLTVLASFRAPKVISISKAITATPILNVSATIPELEKKAVQKKPKDNLIEKPVDPEEDTTTFEAKTEPQSKIPKSAAKQRLSVTIVDDPDWNTLLEAVKVMSVPLHSVLKKCAMETTGTDVTIYAKNRLFKNKLDNPRFKGVIIEALNQQYEAEWEIAAIATATPPKDSQVAQVAAIMEGGEEVALE